MTCQFSVWLTMGIVRRVVVVRVSLAVCLHVIQPIYSLHYFFEVKNERHTIHFAEENCFSGI